MDALLIPVFVLAAITVPVLLCALLLYAVPVRAAVTVILKGERQEQHFLISWAIFGFRTSRTGAGTRIEVLLAGHPVLSHAVYVEPEEAGGTGTAGRMGGSVPDGERSPVQPSSLPGTPPAGSTVQTHLPSAMQQPEPRIPAAPPASAPGSAPPETVAPAPGMTDVSEIIHVVQNLIGPAGSFGSAFWQQSRFVDASGTVTLGLGDPVLTGEVCGMYWASRFALTASRIYIHLEPVFDRTVIELDVTVRMKVRHPLLVLLAGVRLAVHPAVRDAVGFATRDPRGAAAA